MKIRDLIITAGTILTAILMTMLHLWDNFPIFIPLIPLCVMVICFIIDSRNIKDGDGNNWFNKKI